METILRVEDFGIAVSKSDQDLDGYYFIMNASYYITLHANREPSPKKSNRPAGTPPPFKALVLEVHINIRHTTFLPVHITVPCVLCPSSLVRNEPQNSLHTKSSTKAEERKYRAPGGLTTKLCALATNIRGFSVSILSMSPFWRLDFWKICRPLY